MIVEIAALAAILILLNRKKEDKAQQTGGCSVYGQPGYYFTWDELTKTSQSKPNNPSGSQCTNLKRLASNILDPLREITGAPIIVNSAFRSVAVNNALIAAGYDAVPNSRHLDGKAADIRSNKYNPLQLAGFINEYQIPHRWMKVYPDHLHIDIA